MPCRICLRKNMNVYYKLNIDFKDLIEKISEIEVEVNDTVCCFCLATLRRIQNFKNTAKEVDSILKLSIKTEEDDTISAKLYNYTVVRDSISIENPRDPKTDNSDVSTQLLIEIERVPLVEDIKDEPCDPLENMLIDNVNNNSDLEDDMPLKVADIKRENQPLLSDCMESDEINSSAKVLTFTCDEDDDSATEQLLEEDTSQKCASKAKRREDTNVSTALRKTGYSWSEDSLIAAVEAVRSGELPQRVAATKYKIPRRTLRNYLNKGEVVIKRPGKKRILSSKQEEDLCSELKRFAQNGVLLTQNFIREQAYLFCERNNIKHYFNKSNRLAGVDWLKKFVKRNPSIEVHKPFYMNPTLGQKYTELMDVDALFANELWQSSEDVHIDNEGSLDDDVLNTTISDSEIPANYSLDTNEDNVSEINSSNLSKGDEDEVMTEQPHGISKQNITSRNSQTQNIETYSSCQLSDRNKDEDTPPPLVAERGETWSEDNLKAAVKAVQNWQLSQQAAAAKYNIPHRILKHYLKIGDDVKRHGTKVILSDKQEQDLCSKLKRFSQNGVQLTPQFIWEQAYTFCATHNLKDNLHVLRTLAGVDWCRKFLKRNPSITIINPTSAQDPTPPTDIDTQITDERCQSSDNVHNDEDAVLDDVLSTTMSDSKIQENNSLDTNEDNVLLKKLLQKNEVKILIEQVHEICEQNIASRNSPRQNIETQSSCGLINQVKDNTPPPSVTEKEESWSEDNLRDAVAAVQSWQLSQEAAAAKYNIPRRILRRHLNIGDAVKPRKKNPILSENNVSERISLKEVQRKLLTEQTHVVSEQDSERNSPRPNIVPHTSCGQPKRSKVAEYKVPEKHLQPLSTEDEDIIVIDDDNMSQTSVTEKGETWSEDNLRVAIDNVKSCQLTKREAASKYNIPRRILRHHLKRGGINKRRGKKHVLSDKQEQVLCSKLIHFSQNGVQLTPQFIREQAYIVCETHDLKDNINILKILSDVDWCRKFLKRNPSITMPKPPTMNPTSAQDPTPPTDIDTQITDERCQSSDNVRNDEDAVLDDVLSTTMSDSKIQANNSLDTNEDIVLEAETNSSHLSIEDEDEFLTEQPNEMSDSEIITSDNSPRQSSTRSIEAQSSWELSNRRNGNDIPPHAVTKRGESPSENSLKPAVEEVQSCQLSLRAAAAKYNISRKILRNHLKTGGTLKRRGKKPILSARQERNLCSKLKRFAQNGVWLTPQFIREQAYQLCERYDLKHNLNTSKRLANVDWLTQFLERNPSISIRKPSESSFAQP